MKKNKIQKTNKNRQPIAAKQTEMIKFIAPEIPARCAKWHTVSQEIEIHRPKKNHQLPLSKPISANYTGSELNSWFRPLRFDIQMAVTASICSFGLSHWISAVPLNRFFLILLIFPLPMPKYAEYNRLYTRRYKQLVKINKELVDICSTKRYCFVVYNTDVFHSTSRRWCWSDSERNKSYFNLFRGQLEYKATTCETAQVLLTAPNTP